MRIRVLKIVALMLLVLSMTVPAVAEQMISTTLVMRVSRMTQNAVVDAGEDLSMEVNIDGVAPASYQWYFNDVAIDGANQKVYSIVNAAVEDTGIYRMDAFDANGRMLVSMDISARVVDKTVPKSGDASLPVEIALGAMGIAAIALMAALRRRAAA
ncbi:MAG: immunoglobulin domain-containing protein [Candidatus Faecivicinus sp.]